MCGRYATTRGRDDLQHRFEIEDDNADEALEPDYNVAPTRRSAIVLARPPREDPGAEPVRQLRNLQWGLVPSWAKDPKIGNKMINARAETVHEKPSFRRAFARRRGLLPIDGFYEWFETSKIGRSGRPLKQPFFIRRADGDQLPLAVIYEFWKDPVKPEDAADRWLTTFTIITTTATDQVGHVHNRMPMSVPEDSWDAWLDPSTPAETAISLMAPPVHELEIYAVSTRVNNVRNNDPGLIEPVPDDESSVDG